MSDSGPILMGIREYARYRGVSAPAVVDAIKQGKIQDAVIMVGTKKKIDRDTADRLWLENTRINNKNTSTIFNNASEEQQDAKLTGVAFSKSKMAREMYAAKIAQLKYEQKAGKLVRVDDVRRAAGQAARITRDKILSLSDKLAPILASETDIHDIRMLLDKELRSALSEVSRVDFDRMVDDVSEEV